MKGDDGGPVGGVTTRDHGPRRTTRTGGTRDYGTGTDDDGDRTSTSEGETESRTQDVHKDG